MMLLDTLLIGSTTNLNLSSTERESIMSDNMNFKELEEKLNKIPEDAECPISLIKEYKNLIKKTANLDEREISVFSTRYPTMLKMILECNDTNLLDLFLEKLADVQKGEQELKAVENDLAHILNNKYVIPKLNEKK